MRYYVDTCILLNVWKQEIGPSPKRPFWKGSVEFLEQHRGALIVSSAVLRELEFVPGALSRAKALLAAGAMKRVDPDDNIIAQARHIERQERYAISFFDIIHLLLAKRENAILVSRDRALLAMATRYGVACGKPEEFTHY